MSEPVVEADRGLGRLTAGDWIGVALALLGAASLLLLDWVWLPTWEGMFRDFGAAAALPALTALVLWGPFPYLLALPSLACLGLALLPRRRGLAWRRAWIVAAFLVALLGIGFIEWAVRLPLWQLADAVGA